METKGRALYHLLRMNWEEDPTFVVEAWQVEDYRQLTLDELFNRLKQCGVSLNEDHFKVYVEHSDTPEELTDIFAGEQEVEHYDQLYLVVFELWRRLCPGKESLSIFCDELDTLIDAYDREELDNLESLFAALSELERVLDEHADQGEDPKELFQEISRYCAHDLESFIYDFASEQIDRDDRLQASEIIDGFLPYISDRDWFEFLQLRLLAPVSEEETEAMLARMLDQQNEYPDLELLLEIARFLVNRGAVEYFLKTIKIIRPLIGTEADFQEVLAITYEFYRLLDREEETTTLSKMLKKRLKTPLDAEIAVNDPTVEKYFRLIEDLDRSEA